MLLLVAPCLTSEEARASPTTIDVAQRTPPPTLGPPPAVRLTTSRQADDRLSELRLRQLLRIELDGLTDVDPEPTGTLDGERIRVWIDVPTPRRALIEVRRSGRPLARRVLALANFSADVAARVVVIEAAEMVRVQARAPFDPGPPNPEDEGEASASRLPQILLGASYGATILPTSTPEAFFGPGIVVGHGSRWTSQLLYANVQTGFEGGQATRWLELGGSLQGRLALGLDWRLRAGARASLVSLAVPDDTAGGLTGRMAGQLGLDRRLADRSWLHLDLEPGALVAAVDTITADRARATVGGFALGIRLGISYAAPLVPGP